MIRPVIPLFLLALCVGPAVAQETTLTLDACRQAAVTHSPLTARQALAGEKREARDQAVSSSLIPQLELNAQASYQNDVPTFPDDLPIAITFDLPRDQYKATVDLSQVIYGGGSVRNTKRVNEATEQVETASLEVQLDRLRDRINDIYMNILLADRQLAVNTLMRQTLEADMKVVVAQIAHGTATGGVRASLQARLLELDQQRAELLGTRSKLTDALATLTGLTITENTPLEVPTVPGSLPGESDISKRTEFTLFARQQEQLDMQDKLLNSKSNPKLSLFASGGYGRPGYNFFDRDFALMAIGGLRFNLPLTGWDATQKEKRANRVLSRDIDQQQRDFERNTRIEVDQYVTDIEKLQEITALDPQIVAARTDVRQRALAQLKGGVITDSEYLTEFNNEATARINAEINALRLVQAWLKYDAARGIYK